MTAAYAYFTDVEDTLVLRLAGAFSDSDLQRLTGRHRKTIRQRLDALRAPGRLCEGPGARSITPCVGCGAQHAAARGWPNFLCSPCKSRP